MPLLVILAAVLLRDFIERRLFGKGEINGKVLLKTITMDGEKSPLHSNHRSLDEALLCAVQARKPPVSRRFGTRFCLSRAPRPP